ncbi:MAG: PTS sugar transporter subunit IIA [Hyphomonadaceae bacterium]|nr:PTS sugar transporter subunit IIA [Hyphomonadaceae bacterium]MBX3511032.1 PTS sugar transporter subunit IIA [Hyphomonadaceae bacterium]
MNDLSDLIAPATIAPRLSAASRRQVLQHLADLAARSAGVDARAAFEAVLMRERLSGTGMGDGVAIPHAAVKGLERPIGAFARLDSPQDFDALDGRPADLVFMLLSPADRGADHLKALARVSRFFRRADVREKLRAARSVDEMAALFSGALRVDAA